MIHTKKILTRICNSDHGLGYNLSPEDLKKLQSHLIKMYRDIERVCNNHNLRICLAYGNVLGAIRHKGWIPWDDDLDIHLPRKDYELLLTKYADELPPHYKISSYHSKDGSIARFAKIFDTTTTFVPIVSPKNEYSHIFIDIFPIDNCPTDKFQRLVRKSIAFPMMYIASSVLQYHDKSDHYKQIMFSTKEGKRNWKLRNAIGKIFSFASSQKWNRWIELLADYKKETGYSHVVSDLASSYNPQSNELYFPFKEIELPEIGKVSVPNNTEAYLTLTYGKWEEIPSSENQWHHWVKEFFTPE